MSLLRDNNKLATREYFVNLDGTLDPPLLDSPESVFVDSNVPPNSPPTYTIQIDRAGGNQDGTFEPFESFSTRTCAHTRRDMNGTVTIDTRIANETLESNFIFVEAGATLTLQDVTVTESPLANQFSGFEVLGALTIQNSTFDNANIDNRIFNEEESVVSIRDSTFDNIIVDGVMIDHFVRNSGGTMVLDVAIDGTTASQVNVLDNRFERGSVTVTDNIALPSADIHIKNNNFLQLGLADATSLIGVSMLDTSRQIEIENNVTNRIIITPRSDEPFGPDTVRIIGNRLYSDRGFFDSGIQLHRETHRPVDINDGTIRITIEDNVLKYFAPDPTNNFRQDVRGIQLSHLTGVVLRGNQIRCSHFLNFSGEPESSSTAIKLNGIAHALIEANNLVHCREGFEIFGGNNIVRNNITNVTQRPLVLGDTETFPLRGNLIHNNLFGASDPGLRVSGIHFTALCEDDNSCTGELNQPKTAGTNIVGGAFLGGNFWIEHSSNDADGDGLGDTPFTLPFNDLSPSNLVDNFPLVAELGPELVIEPLAPSVSNITFSDGKFTLPLTIFVKNIGFASAEATTLRLQDSFSLDQTVAVDAIDVNADQQIDFVWDVSEQLASERGRSNLQLTLSADSGNAVAEMREDNNQEQIRLDVNAQPRIEQLTPQFALDSAIFLDGVSLDNRLDALIDWNGDLVGRGTPGELIVDLNGSETIIAGTPSGAVHTFNMGQDFNATLTSCANNTLQLHAHVQTDNGLLASEKTTIQPTVTQIPDWLQFAIDNLPGSDPTVSVEANGNQALYFHNVLFPDPAFEAKAEVPDFIPVVGGAFLGVKPTQAGMLSQFGSDGQASVVAAGQTGIEAGLFAFEGESEGRLEGEGDIRVTCSDIVLERIRLAFSYEDSRSLELELGDLVPAGKLTKIADKAPVLGRLVKYIVEIAYIKGTSTVGGGAEATLVDNSGEIAFDNGSGEVTIGGQGTLGVRPVTSVDLNAFLSAQSTVGIQVPANPDFLEQLNVELGTGVAATAFGFEISYDSVISCDIPGACTDPGDSLPGPEVDVLGRPTGGPRFVGNPRFTGATRSAASETTIITNSYAQSELDLTRTSNNRFMLALVQDDLSKPHGRGTEIHVLDSSDGSTWSAPDAITDDQQPDFDPELASGRGKHVLIWQRNTLSADDTLDLSANHLQKMEIATAVHDGSDWGVPQLLTTNSVFDFAPQLATTADGNDVFAIWLSQAGTDLFGTTAEPLAINFAMWDAINGTWSAPATVATGLQDILHVSLAAHDEDEAAIVFSRDMDSDIGTSADIELFSLRFDGTNWSAPSPITANSSAEHAVNIAYSSSGNLHMMWLQDSDLVGRILSPAGGGPAQPIEVIATPADEAIIAHFVLADGNEPTVVWQDTHNGQFGVFYSIFINSVGWSEPVFALNGDQPKTAFSAVRHNNSLALAFENLTVDWGTSRAAIVPPQVTQTDIVFAAESLETDFTITNMTLVDASGDGIFTAGETVSATLTVHNHGLISKSNVSVQLAHDSSSHVTIPSLPAGESAVQTIVSTTPAIDNGVMRFVGEIACCTFDDNTDNNQFVIEHTVDLAHATKPVLLHSADALQLRTTLVNNGQITLDVPFEVTVRADNPISGTIIATDTVSAILAPNAIQSLTLPLGNPADMTATDLFVVVDSENELAESSEANNVQSVVLTRLPDLVVSAESINARQMDDVTITVHNAGSAAASNVAITIDSGDAGSETQSIASIAAGASAEVSVAAPTDGSTITVTVDPASAIAESNEANNQAETVQVTPRDELAEPEVIEIFVPIVQR